MDMKSTLEQAIEIRLGDHMVILYEEEEEVVEYLTAYIHSSLRHNERCIYITGDSDTNLVLEQIKKLNHGEEITGELVLMERDDAYSKDGTFDPDSMIALLKLLAEEAVADGYSGLAVTGEISWLLDYHNGRELIIEYEWKLNEYVFGRYPVSALCRYNMNKFSDDMIINIIQLHPYLIWKNKTHENPFHIAVEGYRNNEISKYQVRSWLENIDHFTDEKSRFRKAIANKEKEMQKIHQTMTDGIVRAMVELLSIHDAYTNNHSENVARLSRDFAKHLKLTDEEIAKIYYAGMVHDIGKTLIPREILNKTGILTMEEYDVVKLHPVYGSTALGHVEKMDDITNAVRSHHEYWNGNGYPDGLRENQIPLAGRILSLVDAFEAMTNDRPYRKAFTKKEAMNEIFKCAGMQFDPALSIQFIDMISNGEII
ncbi:MAG: MEDS domain-containing protein [Dethiosulfatibacter sp.]|nr:MEDS domain-containing protein [Dethiosulfatibacter sp.]